MASTALVPFVSPATIDLRKKAEERMIGLRTSRYSWWVFWRELADYYLPRRYRWLITPNLPTRGSPINQHIIDSTGTLCARNLAAGLMFGVTDPTRPWFKLKIGKIDSTLTSPASLWLAECERLMRMVFHESNLYTALATFYFDLVVFGTAVLLIYEDFDTVIDCYIPCAGEYYLENGPTMRARVLDREFTLTVSQIVEKFGLENCSANVRQLYETGGAGLTNELVIAHAIEPNTDGERYGLKGFEYRELYWEWGGSAQPQGGSSYTRGLLRKRGFHECPFAAGRWDLVSNDSYGRSPAMDAFGDVRQLQVEVRRKAQAIDKLVNPPMVADIQLKNQPASLIPGGVTYVSGMLSQGRPGFAPAYTVAPPVKEITEDLAEIRERISKTFYNDLFQTISQYETRSNVSATEIDARRAESLVMIGPVLGRIHGEVLSPLIERTFAIMARANILPPAPAEIAGQNIDIEYVSMLQVAQEAAGAGGIERTLGLAGNLAGIDPAVLDNIDLDYALEKYSSMMNNDPKMIRSPEALAAIRQRREQAQQAEQSQQASLAAVQGAKLLSETSTGPGKNALQSLTGAA